MQKDFLKDAEAAKLQMLRLLMEEVALAGPALVARVQVSAATIMWITLMLGHNGITLQCSLHAHILIPGQAHLFFCAFLHESNALWMQVKHDELSNE